MKLLISMLLFHENIFEFILQRLMCLTTFSSKDSIVTYNIMNYGGSKIESTMLHMTVKSTSIDIDNAHEDENLPT